MDFYQNAARKQSNQESAEYEIINIEFQGKDQPYFEYGNYDEEYHEPITSLSKQYLDEFQHKDDNFTYYKVEQNDSIYGLELKFEISAIQILRLNNISENSIYPGMILKIPLQEQTQALEQYQENNETYADSVAAQYITQIGAIYGQCSITKHCLMFIADKNNKQNEELIFNANIRDIENLSLQILFKHILIAEEQALEQFLPLIKVQNKKKSVITIYAQTKKQKIVIIKLFDDKKNDEFINKINNSVADFFEHQEQYFLQNTVELKTIIPFHFEATINIVNNDVPPKEQQQQQQQQLQQQQQQQKQQQQKQQQKQQQQVPKQICHDSLQTKLVAKSDIISQEQFITISYHLPFLFKGQKWECVYSSIKNGSSILTLMRKSENRYPIVVVVKDVESYMFGGYLSDGIRNSGGKFYGNGESFLFTFKNDQQIQVYKWTHINNYFTLCDRDGLAIGCGDKYGLYINSEISNGYSCQCDTYGNEILSKKQNFIIDRLELWSISYN